jgi:hypothetical protein
VDRAPKRNEDICLPSKFPTDFHPNPNPKGEAEGGRREETLCVDIVTKQDPMVVPRLVTDNLVTTSWS